MLDSNVQGKYEVGRFYNIEGIVAVFAWYFLMYSRAFLKEKFATNLKLDKRKRNWIN